jgi:hypothetical protein
MKKMKIKNALKILLAIVVVCTISALVRTKYKDERRERIVESIVAEGMNDLNIDRKLMEKFFPVGNFYISVPNTNIEYNTTTEGPTDDPVIIHHTFQSMSENEKTGLIITYSIINAELNDGTRKNILKTVFNDVSNRPSNKKYGRLLYKNDLSFHGFPGLEFGYIQELAAGANYLMARAYVINSKTYVIKVMAPAQNIGSSILSSFRLAD